MNTCLWWTRRRRRFWFTRCRGTTCRWWPGRASPRRSKDRAGAVAAKLDSGKRVASSLGAMVSLRNQFTGDGVSVRLAGRRFFMRGIGGASGDIHEAHAKFLHEAAVAVFAVVFLGEEFVAGEDGIGAGQ